ncbi:MULTISPECIES: hypothetical protein [Pseudomonas]|uniref:Uncharacterized protein n=2 Tax=Pseudomonas chlororaphis group TaxID=136842 RepID=A0A1H4PJZ5_9PSED|nr:MULTISPECIES: hypothetical protein [Pseudomonas]RBJ86108.1 hypothetical protein C3L29_003345 [Pseudomonas sp. MWU12-2534b]MCO7572844.1 hypothetical protein [Pseudomonas chlororaphis]MCO7591084.1 hypothetical protein [Pseudomonas chlororaphis]MDF2399159.1 hypothetical protein [Pseudomonas sp. 3MA1]MDP9530245.1 hypothetical protein [Pseudomonas protegens]
MSQGRAEFHRQHQQAAAEEARRLFAEKPRLQGAWLNWVAGELYHLRPAAYASMVRRELQRLQEPADP